MLRKVWELTWQEWIKATAKWLPAALLGVLYLSWPSFREWLGAQVWLYGWSALLLGVGWVLAITFFLQTLRRRPIVTEGTMSLATTVKPAHFVPFEVFDEGCHVYWRIKRPPSEWVDSDSDHAENWWYMQILEGPFCGNNGCRRALTKWARDNHVVAAKCPVCDAPQMAQRVDLDVLRKETVQAMQRYVRRGKWSLAPSAVFDIAK